MSLAPLDNGFYTMTLFVHMPSKQSINEIADQDSLLEVGTTRL
jgi:hypothetical protein